MPQENFIKEYMGVCGKAFKSMVVITTFQKSGCWPVDHDIFTDEDYTPSIPTSTSVRHVPSSFPLATDIGTQDHYNNPDDDPPAHSMDDPNGLDDESSDDDAADVINSSENLQTCAVAFPAVSNSELLATSAVYPHSSLAPSSLVPGSIPLTSHALLSLLEPVSSGMISTSTGQLKWKCTVGQQATSSDVVQSQLNALSQAYSKLAQQNLKLSSEISTLKAHCAVTGTKIHDLKQQLNVKENKPQKWHKLNVDTRWLNSNNQ